MSGVERYTETDARPDGWLRTEFERARKRREQLPAWARPVNVRVTPQPREGGKS